MDKHYPVYPRTAGINLGGVPVRCPQEDGLTLRWHIAIAAMPVVMQIFAMAADNKLPMHLEINPDTIANAAFGLADAMIKKGNEV